MTLGRTLGMAVATFTGAIALTVLSALPACDPTLQGDDDDSGASGDDDDSVSSGPCEDDAYEPNDSLAEVAAGGTSAWSAILCPDNEDWWEKEVAVDYDSEFSAQWDAAIGGLDLEVFDSSGASLGRPAGEWDEPGHLTLDIGGPFNGAVRAVRTDSAAAPLPYDVSVNDQFCCDE